MDRTELQTVSGASKQNEDQCIFGLRVARQDEDAFVGAE